MSHQLILHWRTARHLKPSQLYYYLIRRLFPYRRVRIAYAPPGRKAALAVTPCPVRGIYIDDSTFRFLNLQANLRDERNKVNWAPENERRLWRYNLHYFDYLREPERPADNKDRLIQSWIDKNPQGSQPGWEPYTASLRISNWIFYLAQRPLSDTPAAWLDSLYLQARWLDRNDERHILANHYFENLKALFFAGCFFDGDRAKRWHRRAQKQIQAQLREQTLRDGSHYERSLLYHCRMLENYLDIINISRAYPEVCEGDFIAEVRTTASRGLEYLRATLFPDGTIPLFNDSGLNVQPPPSELFAYAGRLHVEVGFGSSEESKLINCPDSGLYGCRAGSDMLLIDCGDIGPAYQPGHTHCDFLSYELMLHNRRIVVDTGVCEYEPGALRNYVRSTRAHNTVVVDGGEQSEIWGEFRVARRAKKLDAKIIKGHNMVEFVGAFRGFYNVKNRIEHERTVTVSLRPDGKMFEKLSVTDQVRGQGHHNAESFVHIHPDIAVEPAQKGEINLFQSGSLVAVIRNTRKLEFRIEAAVYCPEFGKQIPNQALIFRSQGAMPLTLHYEIEIIRP